MAEADAAWAAPHARRADVLDPEERDEARVAAALRSAAARAALAGPELLGGAEEVLETLGAVEVWQGDETEGVLLTDPLLIRARRFRAVFVCGLQDGEFPQRPVPEPFLDDEARRSLSMAAGLRLPFHEDVLDRERSLFYACVSRPQEVLFLSWRSSDEEGEPLVASPFLDDVRALFTDELWEQRGRRLLAEVTWSPREAPTPRELQRAQAAARNEPDPPPLPAPVSEPVLAQLDARRTEGARAARDVRGLRGALAGRGAAAPGAGDAGPGGDAPRLAGPRGAGDDAAAAARRDRLRGAHAGLAPGGPAGAGRGARRDRARGRKGARRRRGGRWRPTSSATSATRPSTARGWSRRSSSGASGARATSTARSRSAISRSRGGSTASTSAPAARRSCATTRARARYAGAGWAEGGCVQVALYMLAARELLGLEPVGGLYQALWARDSRPRGLVRDDVPGRYVSTDKVSAEEMDAALEAVRERALETAAALRAGEVRACPEKCSPKGCAYPTICRAGG